VTASSLRRGALPVLAVAAGVLTLELAYGVALGDALLYLAYEIGFVAIPGWLAYRALSARPGGALRQLAMGWALGYVLEILAFMLTAATGTRDLFVAYPVVVGAAAAAAIVRRRPAVSSTHALASTNADPTLSPRFRWVLVAVCLAAVAYIAFAYFPGTPLPGTENVNYFQDYPWAVSIAADAKHHWPIEDPSVSGEPFPYHYFVHIDLAAASQVTGLNLPLVFFRLFILPLVVLLVLELVVAGQSFSRSAYVGLIAACLALFIGELQLDARQDPSFHVPFLGAFFTYLYVSPSFLFGLVIFVPLITLLGERITIGEGVIRPGEWLLVALFTIGASDAKVALLPLVLAALLLYAGWVWLVERRIPLAVWLAAALTLLVSGTVYLLQYRGWSSGVHVDLLAGYHFFGDMPAVLSIKSGLRTALPAFPGREGLVTAGGIVFGVLGLLAAQLVGLIWLFRRAPGAESVPERPQGHRLPAGQAWLFSLLAAGLLSLLVLAGARGEEKFFFFSSLVAGCLLSAEGLRIAWLRRPDISGRTTRLALLGLGCALIVAGLMLAPKQLSLFSGPNRDASTYLFWYGGLVLVLALLYAAARRWIGPTPWAAAALVCGALVAVGTLDTPIGRVLPALTNLPPPPESGHRFTPELYGALNWIRHQTPADSVIAVNNQSNGVGPFDFDYAAFAERRTFLEGWGYSAPLRAVGYAKLGDPGPFAGRLELNKAAFSRGDRQALRVMVGRFGVRYLVVDQINGYPADMPALGRAGRVVYTAPGVSVIELG
jgi:hypothetical protein